MFPDIVEYTDKEFKELGISCAGMAYSDTDDVDFWYEDDHSRMTKQSCIELVEDISALIDEGYLILTWNGTSFDFRVLAIESGMYNECAKMAINNHIDMMLFVTFMRGHYLSLQNAMEGIGLYGKLKDVRLNDGTPLTEMAGVLAPKLWKEGEHDAVLQYLSFDVCQPIELFNFIHNRKRMQWWSKRSGNMQVLDVPKLYTVAECFDLPEIDVSWLDNPPTRKQFVQWVHEPLLQVLLPQL